MPLRPFTPSQSLHPTRMRRPATRRGPCFSRGTSSVCRGIKALRRKQRDSERSGWRNWGANPSSAPTRPPHRAPPAQLPKEPSVSLVNWKHIGLCPKPPVHHGGDGALGSEPESPEDQSLFPRTTAESEPALFPTHLKSHFWEKSLKLLHKPVPFLCPSFLFRIHVLESSVPPEADSLL